MSTSQLSADVAVIGGSGLYALLDSAHDVTVPTPFGEPSDPITIGEIDGRSVAFLPRHGRDHRFPPHRIPYRANLWALRALGVRQILAPCAVGALQPTLAPGAFVVPDQIVDRTSGRVQTYYDENAVHVAFADPYCPNGRTTALNAIHEAGIEPVDGGTLVVIEGPRFSTRAESRWYAGLGWSLVGMTGHPEAVLARELAMCYSAVALVTDLDAGVDAGQAVTHAEVMRIFRQNLDRMRSVILSAVTALPKERDCPCPTALDGLDLPFSLP